MMQQLVSREGRIEDERSEETEKAPLNAESKTREGGPTFRLIVAPLGLFARILRPKKGSYLLGAVKNV